MSRGLVPIAVCFRVEISAFGLLFVKFFINGFCYAVYILALPVFVCRNYHSEGVNVAVKGEKLALPGTDTVREIRVQKLLPKFDLIFLVKAGGINEFAYRVGNGNVLRVDKA